VVFVFPGLRKNCSCLEFSKTTHSGGFCFVRGKAMWYDGSMEKTHIQIQQFLNAYDRLLEVVQPTSVIERDALIQRFEFTFDIGWKTLKSILYTQHNIEAQSPLQTFQEAIRIGIIPNDTIWITIRDARNMTSHVYSEEMAVTIAEHMHEYIKAFDILKSLFTTFI
jgi:nucleotidyltransferase substrate binding protein (TIGR01987 family)